MMEIKQTLRIIRRRWWLVVLGAALAGLAAFLASRNTAPIYASAARLIIDQPPGEPGNEYNQLLLEQRLALTYAEIIKMRTVLAEAIDRLNLPFTPAELGERVAVSALRDTQIVEIRVEDSDPARAAEVANTIGQVFIEQNQARESLRYAEPIANWQARLDTLSAEIARLEATATGSLVGLDGPEAQLAELQHRYGETLANLDELLAEQARQSSNVVLLEAAEADPRPVRPRPLPTTILATLAGGLAGLGLVYLLDYLDDTVRDPAQIQLEAGLPIVGAVGFIEEGGNPAPLVSYQRPQAPITEAYRSLRTNLACAAPNGGLRSLLVTSPMPAEGKSITAANLGIVFAQQGKRVIVVDADLRRPAQHTLFGLTNRQGLATALVEPQAPILGHVQVTAVPNLWLLAGGPPPPNPAELLGSERMAAILARLLEEYDLLLLDSPPALTVTDAAVLAPHAGGCLLVARAGRTKRIALVEAAGRLEATGAHLVGLVLNRVRPSQGYGYYYHYERPGCGTGNGSLVEDREPAVGPGVWLDTE